MGNSTDVRKHIIRLYRSGVSVGLIGVCGLLAKNYFPSNQALFSYRYIPVLKLNVILARKLCTDALLRQN